MKRFTTPGVNENVSGSLQDFLWSLVIHMSEGDYLQVFDLSEDESGVLIKHHQECPEYCETYVLENETISENLKVFMIEDGDIQTMLLADEY